MDLETAKNLLSDGGFIIKTESRLPNDTGTRLHMENGAIVNVYDSGKHHVQGKNTEPVKQLLDGDVAALVPASVSESKEIFVVYGHDEMAKTQLDALLRRWGLTPLFMDQLPSQGQTIIEKLEQYANRVGYAVVLATPDDEGYRMGHPDEQASRARQNVVLELGMMLALLGRQRVAILLKDTRSMEKPSDIAGILYIPFKDDIDKEAGTTLAKELDKAGYHIPVSAL